MFYTKEIILKQLFASGSVIIVNIHLDFVSVNKLELNTEKEGCMSCTTPEDAQRPRAVYDIHPDFRGI